MKYRIALTFFILVPVQVNRERSGSVVECLTPDQGGWGFEAQRDHCIVSLSKTNKSLLSTGLTQEDPSRHD